jgi:UTP--glucose-1-phosphate uridylyltransferase
MELKMKSEQPLEYLPQFASKMAHEKLHPLVIDAFCYYYKKIVIGETGLVFDKDILPVKNDEIAHLSDLQQYTDAGRKALRKSVRIILNGGLGTSMGLSGPKSLLEVKKGRSFLDILLKQAERQNTKLAIMNSFSTNEPTLSALSNIKSSISPLIFLQNKFPKVLRQGFSPANCKENPLIEWNPPGHGDIFLSLYISNTLQKLLDENIEYAFVSNSDNLGATLDESLLGYFSQKNLPFMMEVAEKTPSDIKGGHLARQKNGRLILRESSQCPDDELDAFQNINRYKFFNTNNIWINLKALHGQIKKTSFLSLPMILNQKTLDPNLEKSAPVFQIETAMGAAISLFDNAQAVKVPRARFFPVKKCNELLAIRSDCYVLSKEEKLIVHPARIAANLPDTLKIKLDPLYYGKVDLFEERFKDSIPSLIECESLAIEGNIFFGKNVTIKGNTTIVKAGTVKGKIEEGSVLEGEMVF